VNRVWSCVVAVQVSGLAMVGLGVWLHVNRDSLFYTHLVRLSPRPSTAASSSSSSSSSPSSSVVAASSSGVVQSSSSSDAESPASVSSLTPSLLSADVISVDSWPFSMMAAGSCVTLVGFLGCCGACTESVCFLSFVRITHTHTLLILV